MAWINIKIWTISSKFHYPYEWIFWGWSTPEYIIKEVTWNRYINLTNAVANHLMELKAYGWTEQRNLPVWYTQLDWITGDWSAYIDLNIQLTEEDEADVYFTKPSNLASSNVFWWRTSAWQNNVSVIIAWTWNAVLDFNNSDYTDYRLNTAISLNTTYKAVLNKTGRYLYQWDTLIDSNTTACVDTIETPWTYLFHLAWSWLTSKFAWTINRVVIKWKKDLIPCKDSNNVVWMYDIINGVFYTNANEVWSFTAWPNAVPTPTAPMDIVSNNWVLKFSKNMANVNAQTALVWYYISSTWVVTADSNNRIYQDYIPCKPNTTYTLSLSSSVYYVTISEYLTTDDSGFIRRNAGSSGSNTQLTITTGATTNYLRFWTNIDRAEVTLERVLAINWQLEQWDTPTQYHEYVEWWIYIEWVTETINVHSDNLINLSTVTDGYYYDAQGNYTSLAAARLTDYIPIETGEDVEIYFKSLTSITTLNVRINIFNSNKVWQSQEVLSLAPNTDGTKTITTTANGYIRVSGNYTGGSIVDWSTASIIKSFGTATAEKLLKIWDYADEQEILSWNITRKIWVMVLDWTENWKNISGYINISKEDLGSNSTVMPSNSANIICSHFETKTGTFVDGVGIGGSYVNFKYDSLFTTLAQFQQFLADQYNAWTPVIIVYPLATPTTETVAGQTMNIPSWDSTIEITQASIDNLWLYAKYKATE